MHKRLSETEWTAPQTRLDVGPAAVPELNDIWPAAGSLINFAAANLPIAVSEPEHDNGWLQIAWLPARITDTLFSIMNLGLIGSHADAAALLRVMADHVITFAWLAADEDPPNRYQAWVRHSLGQVRRQSRHVERLGGVGAALPPDDAILPAVPWLDSATAARACDEFWHPFLEGVMQPGTLESFEGLYAGAFRTASAYVHPTIPGGFGYLQRGPRGEILGLSTCAPASGLYSQAVVLDLVAMYVFTVRFCPDEMPALRRLSRLVARSQQHHKRPTP